MDDCVFAVRSAASKGPIDVIGVFRDGLVLVQCKAGRGKVGAAEKSRLEAIAHTLSDLAEVVIVDSSAIMVYNGLAWEKAPKYLEGGKTK